MRRFQFAFALLFCLSGVLSANLAHATLVQLTPIDADTIKPFKNNNYNSSLYIHSYYANDAKNKHTAFMKFDLSSIPDGASIAGMQLQLSSYLIVSSPDNYASILRGDNDNWSSKVQDVYPGTNELLGDPQFIGSSFSFYNWTLNAAAVNWSEDLMDNVLTLAINSPGYLDWFAIDNLNEARRPLLSIDYSPTPPTLGDANGDHVVDGADYTIWADHFLLSTSLGAAAGDFTGDGKVDGSDYTVWADNFSPALLTPGVSAVPEPSTLALAIVGAALIAQLRPRRIG